MRSMNKEEFIGCVETIEQVYSLAPIFNSDTLYYVDQYVFHNDCLYKFLERHYPGVWNGSPEHVEFIANASDLVRKK